MWIFQTLTLINILFCSSVYYYKAKTSEKKTNPIIKILKKKDVKAILVAGFIFAIIYPPFIIQDLILRKKELNNRIINYLWKEIEQLRNDTLISTYTDDNDEHIEHLILLFIFAQNSLLAIRNCHNKYFMLIISIVLI